MDWHQKFHHHQKVGQFCFIQKMPISSFGEHTPKHAKRETKVETRREGARDDRDGRRPRRDSSRRVRFVPFLARRRLSTGRVRPPSRGLLLRAHKKKNRIPNALRWRRKATCAHFYACDEDSNEKDDATLAPLAPLAIRTPVVKLDDDTAAKFIFTIIESFGGGGVFVLLTMRFVCFSKCGWCVVFAVLCQHTQNQRVLFRFFLRRLGFRVCFPRFFFLSVCFLFKT